MTLVRMVAFGMGTDCCWLPEPGEIIEGEDMNDSAGIENVNTEVGGVEGATLASL
jgi:hypothetical protein